MNEHYVNDGTHLLWVRVVEGRVHTACAEMDGAGNVTGPFNDIDNNFPETRMEILEIVIRSLLA